MKVAEFWKVKGCEQTAAHSRLSHLDPCHCGTTDAATALLFCKHDRRTNALPPPRLVRTISDNSSVLRSMYRAVTMMRLELCSKLCCSTSESRRGGVYRANINVEWTSLAGARSTTAVERQRGVVTRDWEVESTA